MNNDPVGSLPGSRLLRFAERRLDQSAVQTIVLPIIADLQYEYQAVPRNAMSRLLLCLRGYWGFWKAIGLHTLVSGDAKMHISKRLSLDLVAFALVLVAAIASVRPRYLATPIPNHSTLFWTVQLLGCFAGLAIAMAFRARITAYCIAGFIAFTASEIAAQTYYWVSLRRSLAHITSIANISSFRGNLLVRFQDRPLILPYRGFSLSFPIHLAVMGAALLGVALGAILTIWTSKFAHRLRAGQSNPSSAE